MLSMEFYRAQLSLKYPPCGWDPVAPGIAGSYPFHGVHLGDPYSLKLVTLG